MIYHALKQGEGCPIALFCEWWLLEDSVGAACQFVEVRSGYIRGTSAVCGLWLLFWANTIEMGGLSRQSSKAA
jgi:hypothetical protein